jgi:S1-C subfamily serine protease
VGFAIPVNVVKEGLKQFQATGRFEARPYLGVQYQMITQQTAIINDVPQGAYVVDVVSGSPAETAGIEVDDIITRFDGKDVRGEDGLANLIRGKKVGDRVSMEVWRDENIFQIEATLGEFGE